MRRLESAAVIGPAEAAQGLDDFLALDLVRYAHEVFMPRIWRLRSNLTTYDACYVSLAEALQATLITCDSPLSSASGHRARIELVGR